MDRPLYYDLRALPDAAAGRSACICDVHCLTNLASGAHLLGACDVSAQIEQRDASLERVNVCGGFATISFRIGSVISLTSHGVAHGVSEE